MLARPLRPWIETVSDAVLCDGWRHAMATVEDRLFYVRQAIRLGMPLDRILVEEYHGALTRVAESEEEMERRDIPYVRAHDWREDPFLAAAVTCEAMGAV